MRQVAANAAGLSSELMSDPVVLDSTPPHHAAFAVCAGSELVAVDGKTFQRTTSGIWICWDSPGFYDNESFVHALEWQLARKLDSGAWNVMLETQTTNASQTARAIADGKLDVSREVLQEASDNPNVLSSGSIYRLSVRAVNRAGLRSYPSGFNCGTEEPCGGASWATEEDLSAEVIIDALGPECANATAWICQGSYQVDQEPVTKFAEDDCFLCRSHLPIIYARNSGRSEPAR